MSDLPRRWTLGVCEGCDGWNGMHTVEGLGMWHNHDGRRCEFLPVEVVEVAGLLKRLEADDWIEDVQEAFRTVGGVHSLRDEVREIVLRAALGEPENERIE